MDSIKNRLAIVSVVYWLLIAYITAALIWWFISLERQNEFNHSLKIQVLKMEAPKNVQPEWQELELSKLNKEKKRNDTKFIGEGLTFLLLILLGATYLYRLVKAQFDLQKQQQNFMMAVTHELKTPIAVVKLNLETLFKHKLNEQLQEKIMAQAMQETNRLNALTNNILVSSQLESRNYRNSREKVQLSQLIRTSFNECSKRFAKHDWVCSLQEDVVIEGDPLLLSILVNNLMENAQKYAPVKSTITCTLQSLNKTHILKVIDEGVGIPDSEKNRIFKKFYRMGNESTRTTKGTGLGLYLCKRIAKDHHAEIFVTDNLPSGAVFNVIFQNNTTI